MLKNYLKVVIRNLARNKTYYLINITGLTIGMTSVLLILQYVINEMNYDRHYKHAKHIYRVLKTSRDGELTARTSFMLAPTLIHDFPEIKKATQIFPASVVVGNGKNFFNETVAFTDQNIFNIFSLDLIKGDTQTTLKSPSDVLITEKIAQKYFGDEDPFGKTIQIKWFEKCLDLKVSGILKPFSNQSHFQFDLIVSMSLAKQFYKKWEVQNNFPILENWSTSIVFTYLLLPENYNLSNLQQKLPNFLTKYVNQQFKTEYFLQPLTQIHLHSGHIYDNIQPQGDINDVILFSTIGFLILIIACINAIVLASAKFSTKSKEIGIRKVSGAKRTELVLQILTESVFITIISLPITITLVEILLPTFSRLVNTEVKLNYCQQWQYIGDLIGITLFVGIFSGAYSAFYLSSLNPIKVLQKKTNIHNKKYYLRRLLIITQLAISVVMIISTVIIFRQLKYVYKKNLGYEKEHLVTVNVPQSGYRTLKSEMLKHYNIQNVSGASFIPPSKDFVSSWGDKKYISVDYGFFKTLQIKFKQGRPFDQNFYTDCNKTIILNEIAVKNYEIKSPIGKEVKIFGKRKIIGVVKDFHLRSLHEKIEPLFFLILPERIRKMVIRIKPQDITETIYFIQKKWNEFYPEIPFEYEFIDDIYRNLYQSENRLIRIVGYFCLLAVFITCLGLYGLVSFTAEQHTKEIGIRKVLGASVSGIVILLTKKFTKWVLVANIIAWPIAWYTMNKWLQNFAYRINIGIWTFILAGVIALVIALLTVSYQAIKTATANPVEALRYE